MVFWTSDYFVSVALLHLPTSTTMSKYNKQSGAKRRAEQKHNEARIPKLITMFKSFSSSTVPSRSAQTELFDQRETSQAMESAALDEKQRLQSEFEFTPQEISKTHGALEYSSDPARWDCFNKQS